MANYENWRIKIINPSREKIEKEIRLLGADGYCLGNWTKAHGAAVIVRDVRSPAATIIKQEALASGIDATVHRDTVTCKVHLTDVLITGSVRGIKILAGRLEKQPFGLACLGAELRLALNRYISKNNDSIKVMGILNVTPDSFSDGGLCYSNSGLNTCAVAGRVSQIVCEGGSYIDIGGVSTRPSVQGGEECLADLDEELKRVIPAVEIALDMTRQTDIKISVDTFRYEVAKKCLSMGVHFINDQLAGSDERIFSLCAESGCSMCIMHHSNDGSADIMDQIHRFFEMKIELLLKKGVCLEKIFIDPGFGFAKSLKENYTVLNNLHELRSFGCGILAGVSRKSMLGFVTQRQTDERLAATICAESIAMVNGADIIRTHNVATCADAVKLIRGSRTVYMVISILGIVLLLGISRFIGLRTTSWLISNFTGYLFILIIVVFQPELRRALLAIGESNLFGVGKKSTGKMMEEIVRACALLANRQIGALIVFERKIDLTNVVTLGQYIDGEVSRDLLLSIFIPYSPMHDGAVIINGTRLTYAGCILPLTKREDIDKQYGTRHRAAIGITEESDAVVIVVSEERGSVSVVSAGTIYGELTSEALRNKLSELLVIDKGDENRDTVVSIPIELYDEEEGYIAFSKPKSISVKLSGPQAFIPKAKNARLLVSLKNMPAGKNYVELTAKNIKAVGLEVVEISPDIVEVEIVKTIKKDKKVLPVLSGEPAKGYKISKIEVTPFSVEVEGSYSDVSLIDMIKTAEINVAGINDTESFNIGLLTYHGIKNIIPNRVKVVVTVSEDIVTESLLVKPKCMNGTSYSYELPGVTVTYKGRSDLLDSVFIGNIVELDCSLIGSKQKVPVKTVPPDDNNVQLISVQPAYLEFPLSD
ncbi:hypothetical protein AAG570_014032 [Ranatra chinensis]|uniref:dihydropteroate synthase n=1 Tax=Ranatra chinensis TaxID=642074 RepID=A0ABD0XSB0_9HEMI